MKTKFSCNQVYINQKVSVLQCKAFAMISQENLLFLSPFFLRLHVYGCSVFYLLDDEIYTLIVVDIPIYYREGSIEHENITVTCDIRKYDI